MTVTCACGGRFRRCDLKVVWHPEYQMNLIHDTDPLVSHWKCDKCGANRQQRKRRGYAAQKKGAQ